MDQANEAQPTARSAAEFEALLRDAEAFLAMADANRARARRYHAGEGALVAGTAWTGGLVVVLAYPRGWLVGAVLASLGVAVGAVIWATRGRVIAPLREEIQRDEQAAVRIVSTLRETFLAVSREAGWSSARVTHDRMRLGRFPIEPRDS